MSDENATIPQVPAKAVPAKHQPTKKQPAKAKPARQQQAAPKEVKAPKIDDSINEGDPTEKTRKTLAAEKKVTVRINSTEQDKDDVFVAVNGYAFNIKRDVEVEIPMSVYHALENAKSSVFRQVKREDGEGNMMIETEIQRFSMSARF